MFTSILRWLGFNLEFKTDEPVKVEPVVTGTTFISGPIVPRVMGLSLAEVEVMEEALTEVKTVKEEIFDLGKPITCLMLTCKRCDKIDPIEGCVAYEDPSLLLWHKLGQWCPLNSVPQETVTIKKRKVNPLKASKREARARAAAKAAS